jgi:hypothetical protein
MLSDAQLVQICAETYDQSAKWDRLWSGQNDDDVWAAVRRVGDTDVIAFRGSVTPEDWYRDFLAIPCSIKPHPELGLVHEGFDEGLDELFEEAAKFLGPNTAVVGHSLGAARAWLFAGRLVIAGCSPRRIAVCGSPRPGCQLLRNILNPISKISFKNRLDPVTDVPVCMPGFPYVEPSDFTALNESPMDFGLLADHDISLYVQGVNRLNQ